MKLARCTHTHVKWPHEDLACITHDGHLLPAPRLVSALDQDRRDRGHALGLLGQSVLERFGRCEQFARNEGGGDTGRSLAP